MRKRRIFTIIELLVVISVIAILAALLMPALKSALDKAKTTQCLSNVRGCGTALALYQGDFNDIIPSKPTGYSSWYTCMSQNGYLPIYKAGKNAVVVCPTAPDGFYDNYCVYGLLTANWTTEGKNSYKHYLSADPGSNLYLDLKKFPYYQKSVQYRVKPSNFILLSDSSWVLGTSRYPRPYCNIEPHRITTSTGGLRMPHAQNKAGNSLFIDGHAARTVQGDSLYLSAAGYSANGSIEKYITAAGTVAPVKK